MDLAGNTFCFLVGTQHRNDYYRQQKEKNNDCTATRNALYGVDRRAIASIRNNHYDVFIGSKNRNETVCFGSNGNLFCLFTV